MMKERLPKEKEGDGIAFAHIRIFALEVHQSRPTQSAGQPIIIVLLIYRSQSRVVSASQISTLLLNALR